MKVNDKGVQLIKSFEGCKLNAYKDSVGIWTIGYGATFYPNGSKVSSDDIITQQQADDLLNSHIEYFSKYINPLIKSKLNDNQFSALFSFAFNLGVGNLEKSTLLKKVNTNPNDATIKDEFLKWNKAKGKVLSGLTRRRQAEADLYFKK